MSLDFKSCLNLQSLAIFDLYLPFFDNAVVLEPRYIFDAWTFEVVSSKAFIFLFGEHLKLIN